MIAFVYADLITLPIALIYRKYHGRRFALKLVGLMFATMVVAALAVDLLFSAAGLIPETRPPIESITDRGIVMAALLAWLTVRRAATDPVCGMRVDHYAVEHRLERVGHIYFFCSAGCHESFEADPERFAGARGTLGWRPRGLLRPKA